MAELQCAAQQEAKIIQHRLKFLLESKGAGIQATDTAAQRTGMLALAISQQAVVGTHCSRCIATLLLRYHQTVGSKIACILQ